MGKIIDRVRWRDDQRQLRENKRTAQQLAVDNAERLRKEQDELSRVHGEVTRLAEIGRRQMEAMQGPYFGVPPDAFNACAGMAIRGNPFGEESRRRNTTQVLPDHKRQRASILDAAADAIGWLFGR